MNQYPAPQYSTDSPGVASRGLPSAPMLNNAVSTLQDLNERFATVAERLHGLRGRALGMPPLAANNKPQAVPEGLMGAVGLELSKLHDIASWMNDSLADLEKIV